MKNRSLISACVIAFFIASSAQAEDFRNVVRSTNGNIAVNSFGNCVRSNFHNDKDACAPEARAVAPQRIAQADRTVYFEFNKYSLTAEAVNKLNSLAARLTSDSQVRSAKIIGYADRIGTVSYNERLSKRRADNVRRYLVSRGFVKSEVANTRWMGESAPVTECPDNLTREELIACLQQDRRVEVEIEYQK